MLRRTLIRKLFDHVRSHIRRSSCPCRIKRLSYFGSASVVAWLALFTSVSADGSTTAVDTTARSVAGLRALGGALLQEAHASPFRRSRPAVMSPAQNAVFLELLGPAFSVSLNYERLLTDQVALRAGIAPQGASWASGGKLDFALPITIAYVGLGGFEVGGGVTLLTNRTPIATTQVGYRLHPRGGAGFQFRAGGMLIAGENVWHPGPVAPWVYLSLGAGF
jgi:hypothetical protein